MFAVIIPSELALQAIKNAQDSNKGQTEQEEEENSVSTESTTSLPGSESDLGRLVFSENEKEGLHISSALVNLVTHLCML